VDGGDVGIPKWRQIEALKRSGAVGPASLMIGDRGVDLDAARRNGLAGAGVLWGYGSADELSAHEPLYLFRSPREWSVLV
jgi:phosphoglycolate phosphatase